MASPDGMNILQSQLPGYKLIKQGKVRDVYEMGDNLLIVATDRLSAFDVILPNPIPRKGEILTSLSNFWFNKTRSVIDNHIVSTNPWPSAQLKPELVPYQKRSVVVKKAQPLAIEAVVRGYLAGSAWQEYKEKGTVCGVKHPSGLKEADRLPQTVFTPATKAPQGEHDENIDFEGAAAIVGRSIAEQVRDASLRLYEEGAKYALTKGIIIADTKFEFGLYQGRVILIDEVLTPDSSRFWPADAYQPGSSPVSFDKQYVRDYLLKIGWNKKPPAPVLPDEVVQKTSEKYQEALKRLAG